MNTLSKVFGLQPLETNEDNVRRVIKDKGLSSTIPVAEPTKLLGIEVEVERTQGFQTDLMPFWIWTDDGSLRNNGSEYKSIPIKARYVEMALNFLFNWLPPEAEFSGRTSIHVHLNVRNMTSAQLNRMLMLYCVFEKSIYRWIGPEREKSIFCVPLYDTDFGYFLRMATKTGYTSFKWTKYTGVNLLPISHFGTVEFRHLYGTRDVAVIMKWINILLSLYKAAMKYETQELEECIHQLNTNSEYTAFVNTIFGLHGGPIFEGPYKKEMSNGISYVKSELFYNKPEIINENCMNKESPLLNAYQTPSQQDYLRVVRSCAYHVYDEIMSSLKQLRPKGTPVFGTSVSINGTTSNQTWASLFDQPATPSTVPPPEFVELEDFAQLPQEEQ